MPKGITTWQLFEKRQTTGITVDGQIEPAPIVGFEWFDKNYPPPVYEPNEDGMMWGLTPVPIYEHAVEKPAELPLIKCDGNSS